MSPAEDVTLGEVARRLDRFEYAIREQFRDVKNDIASLQFVSKDTHQALAERVKDLEDKITTRDRILLASFLLPLVVGLIIAMVVGAR